MIKKILLLAVFLTLALIVLSNTATATTPDYSWYNDTRYIIVNGTNDCTLNTYQLSLDLYNTTGISSGTTAFLAGGSKGNWADIALFDSNHNFVPFYIENGTFNATHAVIWINARNLLQGTTNNVTLYLRFDNSSLAANAYNPYSDISTTFLLGDDFSVNTLNATLWTDNGGNTISNGVLAIASASATERGIKSKTNFGTNVRLISRFKPLHMASSSYLECVHLVRASTSNYMTAYYSHVAGSYYPYSYTYSTSGVEGHAAIAAGLTANTWTTVVGIKKSDRVSWSHNRGAYTDVVTNYYKTAAPIQLEAYGSGSAMSVDWVAVANYTANPPTYSVQNSDPNYVPWNEISAFSTVIPLYLNGSSDCAMTIYNARFTVFNTVGNSTGSTLYTNGAVLSNNWSDLSFFDSNQNPLPFFVETGGYNATAATVDVKFTNLPAGANIGTLFYLCAGNATLGALLVNPFSNITTALMQGDEFSTGTLPDTNLWNTDYTGGSAYYAIANGKITIRGSPTGWAWIESKNEYGPNTALISRAKLSGDGAGGSGIQYGATAVGQPAIDIVYTWSINQIRILGQESADSNADTNYNIYQIKYKTDSAAFYKNNVQMSGSPLSTGLPSAAMNVGAASTYNGGGDTILDWIGVRNITVNEPVVNKVPSEIVPDVQFALTAYSVDQDAGTVTLTVKLNGSNPDSCSVAYATADGTATSPANYTAKSGTLTFSPIETQKTFTVTIAAPLLNIPDIDRTFTVSLSSPSGCNISTNSSTTVTIANVYQPPAPFNTAPYLRHAPINISNVGGTAQTDYPVYLNVSYTVGMQTDFHDLRIVYVDAGGIVQSAPYYFVRREPGSFAELYFLAPSLPANAWDNTTYTLYWANPIAPYVSNGSSTFSYYDRSAQLFGDYYKHDFTIGGEPSVFTDDTIPGLVHMYLDDYPGTAHLTSTDGYTWTTRVKTNIPGTYFRGHAMQYGGYFYCFIGNGDYIKVYRSLDGDSFTYLGNAVGRGPAAWDVSWVWNNFVWVENGIWYMLYEGYDGGGISHIGLASGNSPTDMTKYAGNPVESTGAMNGNMELPRINSTILKPGGKYYMYYADVRMPPVPAYINRAYSYDLHSWVEEGHSDMAYGALSGSVYTHGDQAMCQIGNQTFVYWNPSDQVTVSYMEMVVDGRNLETILSMPPSIPVSSAWQLQGNTGLSKKDNYYAITNPSTAPSMYVPFAGYYNYSVHVTYKGNTNTRLYTLLKASTTGTASTGAAGTRWNAISSVIAGYNGDTELQSASFTFTGQTTYNLEENIYANGSISDYAWVRGTNKPATPQNFVNAFTPTASGSNFRLSGMNVAGNTIELDEIYIRKFAQPEPKATMGEVSLYVPVANFTANKTVGAKPLTVSFTDTSINNATSSWQWNFGDGTANSTLQNPVHTFTNNGTYPITLTVSNADGQDSIRKDSYINVTNIAPVANFTANTVSGMNLLNVQFTDTSTGYTDTWQWNFGDGTANATTKNPQHTYMTPGTYSVSLTVSNDGGISGKLRTNYIVVSNQPPISDFSANVTSGNSPLAVGFTALPTGGTPGTYTWNFGDGSPLSNEINPVHVYVTPGVYSVSLNVSNSGGSDTRTRASYIAVLNTTPVAAFHSPTTVGVAPFTPQFIDDSTGAISSWAWNFGDLTANSTQQNPQHTYLTAGVYNVTLTVTNDGGSSTVVRSSYINVTENTVAPEANFTAAPTSGYSPLTVYFTDTSTNSPNLWQWNFGDGTANSTSQNPVHVFASPGSYIVTLYVSNIAGSSAVQKASFISAVATPTPTPTPVSLILSVHVVSSTGPVIGAANVILSNGIGGSWQTSTDGSGNAQFNLGTNPAAGTYTVQATKAGFNSASAPVVVPGDFINGAFSITLTEIPLPPTPTPAPTPVPPASPTPRYQRNSPISSVTLSPLDTSSYNKTSSAIFGGGNSTSGGGDFALMNIDNFLGAVIIPFIQTYGPFFWAGLFGVIALIIFIRQENAVIPMLLTIIGGLPIIIWQLPYDWQKGIGTIVILIIAGLLYAMRKKR